MTVTATEAVDTADGSAALPAMRNAMRSKVEQAASGDSLPEDEPLEWLRFDSYFVEGDDANKQSNCQAGASVLAAVQRQPKLPPRNKAKPVAPSMAAAQQNARDVTPGAATGANIFVLQTVFSGLDTNGTGVINPRQFSTWWKNEYAKENPDGSLITDTEWEQIRELWRQFEIKSGGVDVDSFHKLSKQLKEDGLLMAVVAADEDEAEQLRKETLVVQQQVQQLEQRQQQQQYQHQQQRQATQSATAVVRTGNSSSGSPLGQQPGASAVVAGAAASTPEATKVIAEVRTRLTAILEKPPGRGSPSDSEQHHQPRVLSKEERRLLSPAAKLKERALQMKQHRERRLSERLMDGPCDYSRQQVDDVQYSPSIFPATFSFCARARVCWLCFRLSDADIFWLTCSSSDGVVTASRSPPTRTSFHRRARHTARQVWSHHRYW